MGLLSGLLLWVGGLGFPRLLFLRIVLLV